MGQNIPERCEYCEDEIKNKISVKNEKRCRFVTKSQRNANGYPCGPWDACALKIIAKCGHQTRIAKYSGGCIGAEKCPDFKPEHWWEESRLY